MGGFHVFDGSNWANIIRFGITFSMCFGVGGSWMFFLFRKQNIAIPTWLSIILLEFLIYFNFKHWISPIPTKPSQNYQRISREFSQYSVNDFNTMILFRAVCASSTKLISNGKNHLRTKLFAFSPPAIRSMARHMSYIADIPHTGHKSHHRIKQ